MCNSLFNVHKLIGVGDVRYTLVTLLTHSIYLTDLKKGESETTSNLSDAFYIYVAASSFSLLITKKQQRLKVGTMALFITVLSTLIFNPVTINN